MAALNFPINPVANDEYTANGLTFRFDGTKWDAVTTLASNNTDNISEGSSNLYYTDARARNALSASGIITYDAATGVISAVSESIEDILGATISGGTGISVSYADNGANSGLVTISASVASSHVASEREVQIGTDNTKIVTPLGLENSKPAKGGRQAWTGYTYETGTVDVAGEIKKDSDGNWNAIATSGHTGLHEEIRPGTHIRIEHDSSNYEEGTVLWAVDNGTQRRFRLETGFSSAGSFSDGDSVTLTTEGETQKAISDRTDIARTNVAETFDLGLTVTSGNLVLSSGDLTLSSGDLSVSENADVSGSLTVGGSASFDADTILLNADESGTPSADVGIEVERGTESNKKMTWDESEDKWSFGTETVAAGKFEGDGSGITGIAASQVSGLPADTDSLTEGSSNLYYTDARADARIAAADTDDLSEGSSNLYYTDARADARIAAADTDDLSEGSSNLYHTGARVEGVVSGYVVAGTGLSIVHADVAGGSNTLTFSATAAVPAAQVATEKETQQGTSTDKTVTPQRLEQYRESEHPLETWTGYAYETGTLAAGNLVKSGGEWSLINLAADSGLFDRVRQGSRVRVAHDSSNYEDGIVEYAHTSSSTRIFKLETGFSSAGSFSDGDTLTLTTEGKKVHEIRDGFLGEAVDDRVDALIAAGDGLDKTYTDSSDSLSLAVDSTVARTNAAETFDLALTVASGGVTLTSGNVTVTSGDIDVTAGDMTLASGDLTLSQGGMTLTSGDLTLSSGDLSVSENVSVSGNMVISGNFTVAGTTTTVNTETIELADNIILINSNATGTPTQNGGIEIERGDSANKSILWNETDDKWTVGSETLVAGKFEGDGSGITGIAASQVSGLPSDTDDLSEGSSNLYHTTARARGAVSASSDAIVDYDSSTGVIDTDDSALNSHVSGIIAVAGGIAKSVAANGTITLTGASAVSVGTSAPASPSAGDLWWKSDTAELFLYYNDGSDSAWVACAMPADADVDLTNADTDDLSEGSSNQYFTNARARGAVSASSDAIVDYDSSTGVFSTDDSQLATEVDSILSAGTGIDISKTNDVITLSADIDEVVTASSDAIVNVSNSGLITTDDSQLATEVAAIISAGTGLSESKTNDVVTLAVNADTDGISEGSSNLYHTDARARGAVSASSDAIIDYNSTTGVFSTDDSQLATEIDGILSAGTGVDISKSNNVITVSADIDEVVTASSDAIVNVSNSGLITTDDTQFATEVAAVISAGTGLSESKTDNVVTLAVDADTDEISEGSTNLYHTSARARGAVSASSDAIVDYDSSTGIFTTDDAQLATEIDTILSSGTGVDISKSNNVITVSADIDEVVTASSDAVVNVSNSGLITTDVAEMGNRIAALVSAGTGLSESKNGDVTTLALSADTDDLTEGSTNLFFTDARAQAAITASTDAVVNVSAGVISNDDAQLATEVDTIISAGTGISKSKNGNVVTISNAQAITSSATAPSSPSAGDLWFNSETTELLIYYSDGTDSSWVGISAANANSGGFTRMAAITTDQRDGARLHGHPRGNADHRRGVRQGVN